MVAVILVGSLSRETECGSREGSETSEFGETGEL